MLKKLKKAASAIGGVLFALYMGGVIASVPYFNWKYASEHGFVKWLFFGEIVPTMKAVVWPYFAFAPTKKPHWSDEEKQNATHYFLSTESAKSATMLGNNGPASSLVTPTTFKEMLRLRKFAVQEALLVRDDVLEKAYAGMSKPFREKYQRGLQLQIRAVEQNEPSSEFTGSNLHDEWVDWFNAHRSEIRFPK
jgi:hypothetical protein